MTDYTLVLTRRYVDRKWTMNGDDYDQLIMLDGGDKPAKEALDDVWESVLEEIQAEKQAAIAAKESAKAKLTSLGLTEAEVSALLG